MTVLLTDGGTLSAVKQAAVASVADVFSVSARRASAGLPAPPSRYPASSVATPEARSLRAGDIRHAGRSWLPAHHRSDLFQFTDHKQKRDGIGKEADDAGRRGEQCDEIPTERNDRFDLADDRGEGHGRGIRGGVRVPLGVEPDVGLAVVDLDDAVGVDDAIVGPDGDDVAGPDRAGLGA